ncbi:DUF1826 domain-containing protein [Marinomonas epiphytica]
MTSLAQAQTDQTISKTRYGISGLEPSILTDIYNPDINMVVWKRQLPDALTASLAVLLEEKPYFKASMTVTPESALASLEDSFKHHNVPGLSDTIAELVDMFCCLFELRRVGLRIEALEKAMCPRFHVDKVPCRLVSTLYGVATEWLPHNLVNRDKLGRGSQGLPDQESGLFPELSSIQQLECGDVALLKGENWLGNENAGLVHRSPKPKPGHKRLVLTLDFIG